MFYLFYFKNTHTTSIQYLKDRERRKKLPTIYFYSPVYLNINILKSNFFLCFIFFIFKNTHTTSIQYLKDRERRKKLPTIYFYGSVYLNINIFFNLFY